MGTAWMLGPGASSRADTLHPNNGVATVGTSQFAQEALGVLFTALCLKRGQHCTNEMSLVLWKV